MMAMAADKREVHRDPDADLDSSNSYSTQEGINSQGNMIALCNTDRVYHLSFISINGDTNACENDNYVDKYTIHSHHY